MADLRALPQGGDYFRNKLFFFFVLFICFFFKDPTLLSPLPPWFRFGRAANPARRGGRHPFFSRTSCEISWAHDPDGVGTFIGFVRELSRSRPHLLPLRVCGSVRHEQRSTHVKVKMEGTAAGPARSFSFLSALFIPFLLFIYFYFHFLTVRSWRRSERALTKNGTRSALAAISTEGPAVSNGQAKRWKRTGRICRKQLPPPLSSNETKFLFSFFSFCLVFVFVIISSGGGIVYLLTDAILTLTHCQVRKRKKIT